MHKSYAAQPADVAGGCSRRMVQASPSRASGEDSGRAVEVLDGVAEPLDLRHEVAEGPGDVLGRVLGRVGPAALDDSERRLLEIGRRCRDLAAADHAAAAFV